MPFIKLLQRIFSRPSACEASKQVKKACRIVYVQDNSGHGTALFNSITNEKME